MAREEKWTRGDVPSELKRAGQGQGGQRSGSSPFGPDGPSGTEPEQAIF